MVLYGQNINAPCWLIALIFLLKYGTLRFVEKVQKGMRPLINH